MYGYQFNVKLEGWKLFCASIRQHAEILKMFAAAGINGVFLDTAVQGDEWFTSREAVERFMNATLRRKR
jgi:hypothetical protein